MGSFLHMYTVICKSSCQYNIFLNVNVNEMCKILSHFYNFRKPKNGLFKEDQLFWHVLGPSWAITSLRTKLLKLILLIIQLSLANVLESYETRRSEGIVVYSIKWNWSFRLNFADICLSFLMNIRWFCNLLLRWSQLLYPKC